MESAGPQHTVSSQHEHKVEQYYRFHARIYDATRWSFLFGRASLLDKIPDLPSRPNILEIGCGTGKNIERLEYHFPDAHITGLDLSKDMLRKARKRLFPSSQVKLKQARYGSHCFSYDSFDLILLSYSLTMFGDDFETVFEQISNDLKAGGVIAVVDFDTSPFSWFRRWMELNHVDFSGRLRPLLNKYFTPTDVNIHKAYGGLWTYLQFIGRQA